MNDGSHHEAILELPPPLPSERSTGFVFAAMFLIVAVLLRSSPAFLVTALLSSFAFLALALFSPTRLAPLNRAWFRLAMLLNRFVSPVVMFVIYALVIVPAGLIMQMLRDPLQASRREDRSSYWIAHDRDSARSSMSDQF